jgi:hypothetical protein
MALPKKVVGLGLLLLVAVGWVSRAVFVTLTDSELNKAMRELASLGFVPHPAIRGEVLAQRVLS